MATVRKFEKEPRDIERTLADYRKQGAKVGKGDVQVGGKAMLSLVRALPADDMMDALWYLAERQCCAQVAQEQGRARQNTKRIVSFPKKGQMSTPRTNRSVTAQEERSRVSMGLYDTIWFGKRLGAFTKSDIEHAINREQNGALGRLKNVAWFKELATMIKGDETLQEAVAEKDADAILARISRRKQFKEIR